jgi:hypothetical protein
MGRLSTPCPAVPIALCGAIACGGESFATDGRSDAGQETDAADQLPGNMPFDGGSAEDAGGSGPIEDAAGSGPAEDATGGGVGPSDVGPPTTVELHLLLDSDTDDATWINGTDERLYYGADELNVEVGTDAEMGRIGLRFAIPVPPGAVIESAVLRLYRVDGDAAENGTMQVQVFDSVALPPFDDAHTHAPAEHAPIWPVTVSGFPLGGVGDYVESPNLRELVQHIVDEPAWIEGGAAGFLISPDDMSGWAAFADSASGSGQTSLDIVYLTR